MLNKLIIIPPAVNNLSVPLLYISNRKINNIHDPRLLHVAVHFHLRIFIFIIRYDKLFPVP